MSLPMKPENIPDELKERRQWVVWKLVTRKGKATKVPFCARNGGEADATDPSTWSDFDEAIAAYQNGGWTGIGYVFSPDDPFAGMDMDKCRDPELGTLSEAAAGYAERLDSYMEVSPSGTGVKVVVRASHPGFGHNKRYPDGHAWEMYDAGRYFALTGHILPDCPRTISERRGEFNAIHREIFGVKPVPARPERRPVKTSLPDDQEMLDKARSASNGHRFSALYDGQDGYGSPSEADLALCGMLAFWTGGDIGRMDRLFRSSGLMRDKWDEQRGQLTYGQKTLNAAMAGRTEFYDPQRGRQSASEIVAKLTRPAPSNRPEFTAADAEPVPDARALISQIRDLKDATHAKRQAMSAIVLTTLGQEGQLHRDPDGGLWYFDNARHELLRVSSKKEESGEMFSSRLALRFGLNRTEAAFGHVLADVEDAARSIPETSLLRRWSHFDDRTKRLYVSDGNGYAYRLDGKQVCRLHNGEDGVLFAAMPEMEALPDLDFDAPRIDGDDLLTHILGGRFEDTEDLKKEHQLLLWHSYVYSLPFEDRLPTKPIPVFVGEKGSGKSLKFKALDHLLLGSKGNVSPLPSKQEDFDAALYNSRFYWLDNVDTYQPWLTDALACCATGGSMKKRKYYTSMGMERFTPRCWIGITTREPKFRRDDVADRCIFFRVSRLDGESVKAEKDLLDAIDRRRPALFAEYLLDLNRIVRSIQQEPEVGGRLPRMADWGQFFLRLMRLQNREEEGRTALEALEQEQISFTVTGDPLYEMLDAFIPQDMGWTPEIDAADLARELTLKAKQDGREKLVFKPHQIGTRLANRSDGITRDFEVRERTGGGRKRFYMFRRRPRG